LCFGLRRRCYVREGRACRATRGTPARSHVPERSEGHGTPPLECGDAIAALLAARDMGAIVFYWRASIEPTGGKSNGKRDLDIVIGADPCRLARQVNQIAGLAEKRGVPRDPCRLARQVNQIGGLAGGCRVLGDPCRLVRQVNQIAGLAGIRGVPRDPCRLVRQVNQIDGLPARSGAISFTCRASRQGSGVNRNNVSYLPSRLAFNLVHPPDKLAGVV